MYHFRGSPERCNNTVYFCTPGWVYVYWNARPLTYDTQVSRGLVYAYATYECVYVCLYVQV